MATTTNYSWTTPDDTDLVKDGASAIRSLGSAIDSTVFTNAGNAVQKSTIDAKGDLLVGTADNTIARLAVGTNGHTLVADSTESTGLKWAAPAGASSGPTFRAFRNSQTTTLTANTFFKVPFNAETFDTDSCYDSTTNFRFTPNKAGYYQINTQFEINQDTNRQGAFLFKNGNRTSDLDVSTSGRTVGGGDVLYFNGTTDYVEAYAITNSGTPTIEGEADGFRSHFSGIWIRS